MKNNVDNEVIYSINIADVQKVSEELYDRKLTYKELEMVELKIGDFINWYDALDMTINQKIIRSNRKQ